MKELILTIEEAGLSELKEIIQTYQNPDKLECKITDEDDVNTFNTYISTRACVLSSLFNALKENSAKLQEARNSSTNYRMIACDLFNMCKDNLNETDQNRIMEILGIEKERVVNAGKID